MIEESAFKNCAALERITISEAVLRIGSHAFEGCKKLKSLVLKEGLLQIGNKAFYKCSALKKCENTGKRIADREICICRL